MTIFDKFQNLPKKVFTRTFESDYSGVYFVNILCVYGLPTYYPKPTLNNDKVRRNINIVPGTKFGNFQNSPKIVFTRSFESDYCGIYFVNILCVCDLPTYYTKSPLNIHKVRKNINIVLVTISDKFQNFPKIVLTRTFESDLLPIVNNGQKLGLV